MLSTVMIISFNGGMEATSGVAHTTVPTPLALGTMSPQVWLHAAIRFSQAMSFPLKGVSNPE